MFIRKLLLILFLCAVWRKNILKEFQKYEITTINIMRQQTMLKLRVMFFFPPKYELCPKCTNVL